MILNSNGEVIENPDLTLGHLVDREEVIKHPAIKAKPAGEKLVEKAPGLYERIITPAVFPRPAYEETKKWQEYVPYTDEELAEREAQAEAEAAERAEAEAAAAAEATTNEQRKQIIDVLPDTLIEFDEQIAMMMNAMIDLDMAIAEVKGE